MEQTGTTGTHFLPALEETNWFFAFVYAFEHIHFSTLVADPIMSLALCEIHIGSEVVSEA